MKDFEDLGSEFEANIWTKQEADEIIALLKQRLPEIPAVYSDDEDTGVHLGTDGEVIFIQKCFVDRKGNEVHRPLRNRNIR